MSSEPNLPTASDAAAASLAEGPRGHGSRKRAFKLAMLSSLAIAIATLVALVAQDAVKGIGSINLDFFTNYASSFPENQPGSGRPCWARSG